jgi:hypothetical protein
MFAWALFVHSILRWIVVTVGTISVYRAVNGYLGRRHWTRYDGTIGLGFVLALDLQLVLGSLLYIRSPITVLGIHELDLTLQARVLRFWTFEHPLLMIAAVVLAHVGSLRIRQHEHPRSRHRTGVTFLGPALLLVLTGIPWPFLSYGRPLLSFLR